MTVEFTAKKLKSPGNCGLVIFTEETLNGKLHFLCSDSKLFPWGLWRKIIVKLTLLVIFKRILNALVILWIERNLQGQQKDPSLTFFIYVWINKLLHTMLKKTSFYTSSLKPHMKCNHYFPYSKKEFLKLPSGKIYPLFTIINNQTFFHHLKSLHYIFKSQISLFNWHQTWTLYIL